MDRTLFTGSLLHDLVRCDHRILLNLHGDESSRNKTNEFVEMLWEGGVEQDLETRSAHSIDCCFSAGGKCLTGPWSERDMEVATGSSSASTR